MIIIFCGIPGSGKTTIAKKLASELKKQGSVQLFISEKLKPPVYPKFFKLLKENLTKSNLTKSDFVIFDATFYKKKWRDEMIKLAKGERVVVVYVKCSVKEAVARNKKRKAKIPESAVHIIFNQFEEPEAPDIIIDSEKESASQAMQKILNLLPRF